MRYAGAPVEVTEHFLRQAVAKGFDAAAIVAAVEHPAKVTRVTRHEGQVRACGAGVAVVLAPLGRAWRAVTLYADGVVTPIRPDQLNDPAALCSRRLARLA